MATIVEPAATPGNFERSWRSGGDQKTLHEPCGFLPMRRVFGKKLRLPVSLMSTDALDREMVQLSANEQIQRLWEIREIAAKEWMKRRDQQTVRRNVKAQTKNFKPQEHQSGHLGLCPSGFSVLQGLCGARGFPGKCLSSRSGWVALRDFTCTTVHGCFARHLSRRRFFTSNSKCTYHTMCFWRGYPS